MPKMVKMSSEQWREECDKELLDKTPAMVRRESIANLPRMNSVHRRDVGRRIKLNDDITAAKARQAAREASRV